MTARNAAPPLIVIAGPTAVGKTSLSLRLARRFRTEIVNADSMQVYRLMDIGTAKPTAEERAAARHHLLDVVNPDQPFDAATYADLARPVVDELRAAGKVPIVVGGTGLYMKILLRGICEMAPVSPPIREALESEESLTGLPRLYEQLRREDPVLAARLHPNDRQRILRGLEVLRLTGRRLSDFQQEHRFKQVLYPAVKLFLTRGREELYGRIDTRVRMMIDEGLEDEVRGLLDAGYGAQLKPMQSLGYRQMVEYIFGKISLEKAAELIGRDTRRYAKRQMTWFRADPGFDWVDARDERVVEEWVARRLKEVSESPG